MMFWTVYFAIDFFGTIIHPLINYLGPLILMMRAALVYQKDEHLGISLYDTLWFIAFIILFFNQLSHDNIMISFLLLKLAITPILLKGVTLEGLISGLRDCAILSSILTLVFIVLFFYGKTEILGFQFIYLWSGVPNLYGFKENPNAYGYYICLSNIILLLSINGANAKTVRYLLIGLVIINSFALIGTFSRVAIFINLLVLYIRFPKSLSILGFIVVWYMVTHHLQDLQTILEAKGASTGYRALIMKHTPIILNDHLYWGIGWNEIASYFENIVGFKLGAHNVILALVLGAGLFSPLPAILLIYLSCIRSFLKVKVMRGPILLWSLTSLTHTSLFYDIFIFPLIVSLIQERKKRQG